MLLPTTDRFPFAGNTTLWVLVLTTVGYLVVVALARRLSPFLTHRASFLAAGGLTAAGTVTLPIALTLGSGAAEFAWFLAGTVSLSLGNAAAHHVGELWSALATGRVGRHLYVSYTFAFVLFFVAYAAQAAAVAFTAALPIVSAAVLVAASASRAASPQCAARRAPSPWGIFACILVISIVYGASQGMVNTFAEGDAAFTAKALLLAGCALAAITLSMVVAPSAAEPIALYRPVIPAMVAGLILLLLLPAPYRFLARAGHHGRVLPRHVHDAGVHRRGVPRAHTRGAVVRPGHPLRPHRHAHQVVRRGPATERGAVVGGRCAPRCSSWACWRSCWWACCSSRKPTCRSSTPPRARKPPASLEQSAAIARMCRLTNREAEVLVLLARGRTVRYICDELSIAQGTAKHHVSNIYRKVGVFDRQGLLDTIEQGGVGSRAGSSAGRWAAAGSSR
ncbi:MAG: response regulator transcription factor [Eggerthellaceae bacterium]